MKLLTIFFLLLASKAIFACSCGWQGGFIKCAQENDLTIHAKVHKLLTYNVIYKDTITSSIQVEIIQKLKGETERKFVTVWGDRGADCRPYLGSIKVGSELILSLHEIGSDEYAISNCGEHYLPVFENKTWGYIIYNDFCSTEQAVVLSIDSLKFAINNPEKFIEPTRLCEENEEIVYIKANQMPRIATNYTITEYLKEKLEIKRASRKKYREKLWFNVRVDTNGVLSKIELYEGYYNSKWMERKYKNAIIEILKKSSPWIPGEHRNRKLKMQLTVRVEFGDLIVK